MDGQRRASFHNLSIFMAVWDGWNIAVYKHVRDQGGGGIMAVDRCY